MKLRFDIPKEAESVSLIARFNASTAHKSMVFLVEYQTAEGKAVRNTEMGWSKALQANFVYCPEVVAAGTVTLAALSIPDEASSVTVQARPWRAGGSASVLDVLDGLHASSPLKESSLKLTMAGVDQ